MLIVADGRRLNFLDYEVNQQQSWPIADSPLSVLLDPSRDLARYARVIRDDASTVMIEARDPRRREFGRITLAFAKSPGAGRAQPAGLEHVDAQNNLTQVRLSGQRFNVAVADSLFRFACPAPRAAPLRKASATYRNIRSSGDRKPSIVIHYRLRGVASGFPPVARTAPAIDLASNNAW